MSTIKSRLRYTNGRSKRYHPYEDEYDEEEMEVEVEIDKNVSMRVLLLTWLCMRMKLRCP
jgi:hypothetical protein